MSFIINYMNNHLMIHFSSIIEKANVQILNENSLEIKSFRIINQDFANFNLPLEKGNYQVKIVEKNSESLKSIIVK